MAPIDFGGLLYAGIFIGVVATLAVLAIGFLIF